MADQEPVSGGIVAVLQFIAFVSVGVAFVGGALAQLSLGAEIILMASVIVTAALIWAASAVIQELRNITFNTRHALAIADPTQPSPTIDEVAAMREYGIEHDGNKYRFGEYRYDHLSDAVAYARKQKSQPQT